MKLIVWALSDGAGLPTAKDCCTGAAEWNVASPGWLASIVQVPASSAVTVAPEIAQTDALDWATASATGSPEVAVAVTVYEVEPAVAPTGGDERKLTAWGARSTGNACCTLGAARWRSSPP